MPIEAATKEKPVKKAKGGKGLPPWMTKSKPGQKDAPMKKGKC